MATTSYKLDLTDSDSKIKFQLVQGQESKNLNDKDNKDSNVSLFLKDFSFKAEMYSYNTLELVVVTNNVSLEEYKDITFSMYKVYEEDNNKTTTKYIAQNYYVVEKKFKVISSEANQREYKLKAYSADYFLTIDKFCQAFTGKTLIGGIISPTLTYCKSKNFNRFRSLTGCTTADNLVENLQNFLNDSIIPYAVQYNESFYDFMVRMCNRDGEFLYFGADNKLHVGLAKDSFSLDTTAITEAEYIQTYDKEDETHWIEPDYLGRFKTIDLLEIKDNDSKEDKEKKEEANKKQLEKFDYIKKFNEPTSSEESNLYSNCCVLAPEYLENLSQNKEYRGEYTTKDDYFAWFSEITTAIRTFAVEGTILDSAASIAKFEADRWIHIKYWINGINETFDDKFKYIYRKDDKPIDRTYLYADCTRSNANYKDIYNKLETYQTSQLRLKLTGDDLPNIGDLVVWNGKCYVVYNIEATFLSKDNDAYSQGYEMLLLQCTVDPQDASNYIVYPLPMPEKRYCKSSAQRAKVMDNFDPSRLGRVRVKFPWQKETDIEQDKDKNINEDNNWSPWIRVATPMASDGAGFLFIPAIGDEVLVDFENGNIECPYVIGSFYNESNKPSVASQSQTHGKVKSITSANGHHISFTDNGGGERYLANFLPLTKYITSFGDLDKVTFDGENAKYFGGGFEISDYYGIYSITGSTHNRSISISSPYGDVCIDAFQGITINAPLGDVKIVGKNVSIEARNNLTLESGTNIQGYFANKNNYIKIPEVFMSSLNSTVGFDLSFLRNYLEVLFRPIGGTLLLKSNRYMRLEAGDGETATYDAEKKITKNNILTSLVNIESPSPLQDAKIDAVSAYDGLINYKNKLESIVTHYNDYIQQEDVVNFFENDNSVKMLGDVKIIITNGGRRVSKYFLTLTDFDYISNIESTRKDLEECYKMGIKLKKFKHETFKRIVNEFWDNIRRCLNRQATPNFDIPFTKRELVYENLKRIVESNKDLKNSISVANWNSQVDVRNLVSMNTTEIQDISIPFYKEMGKNAFNTIKNYSGIKDLSDDKKWSSKDKGVILFSSDKNSFFKMNKDGVFEKGWTLDYTKEFIDIMGSVND